MLCPISQYEATNLHLLHFCRSHYPCLLDIGSKPNIDVNIEECHHPNTRPPENWTEKNVKRGVKQLGESHHEWQPNADGLGAKWLPHHSIRKKLFCDKKYNLITLPRRESKKAVTSKFSSHPSGMEQRSHSRWNQLSTGEKQYLSRG